MPLINWDDLRFLLAASRGGTVRAGAQLLGVDTTTLARRLATLEERMETRLVQRQRDGQVLLTDAGVEAVARASAIEREIERLGLGTASKEETIAGTIRLTAVPFVVNRMLVPAVGNLVNQYPDLEIELVAESRELSLPRREADLALRMARPVRGGAQLKTRRLCMLEHAPYALKGGPSEDWIAYTASRAGLPQAVWTRAVIDAGIGRASPVRVCDAEGAHEAVLAGYGRAFLACTVAERDERLIRVKDAGVLPVPPREIWLLLHKELSDDVRIRAVVRWLEETFNDLCPAITKV